MSTRPPTRTSTDPSRFRRGLIGTIVALALACAGLGTASVLQGPRLKGAVMDAAAAVAGPSLLRLVIDEAIAPLDAEQVSISPDMPFTVDADRDVVLVHLERALDYGTSYRVTLAGVVAAAGGTAADITYDLTTPGFQAAVLVRSNGGDRIVSVAPGRDPQVLYQGDRIQDFLPLPGAVFVVSLDVAGTAFASIVAIDGTTNAESLVLPGGAPGRIENFALSGTSILYTFTTLDPTGTAAAGLPVFDHDLFQIDLEGAHDSVIVPGPGGAAFAVDTVIPVPGSAEVLLHSRAGSVYRYALDPATPPTLLAAYTEMTALSADGKMLAVTDSFGPLLYDLETGSEQRVQPSPLEESGAVPFVGAVIPLSGGRWIERALLPDADYTAFDSSIALDDGSVARTLYRSDQAGASILNFRLTANERYLLVETSPGGASLEASDGYQTDDRPRDVTTLVVDVGTGDVVAQWTGSHARW